MARFGTRGDGDLHISFVSMGQGDCTLVSLPNGKTMMIDCGTTRWDTKYNTGEDPTQSKKDQDAEIATLRLEVIDTVREQRFLKDVNELDVLILSHKDKDHCIELKNILFPVVFKDGKPDTSYKKISKVKDLYHSGELNLYPLYQWLQTASITKTHAISVNQDGKKVSGVDIPAYDPTKPDVFPRKDGSGWVEILDGTKGAGKNCRVYILASNVKTYDGFSDGSTDIFNQASIVTLIKFGSKKFLFSADATVYTEKFLIDTYGDNLANLELVQVGHHGSETTSSSDAADTDANRSAIAFVDKVNPQIAIFSAATSSGRSLMLPRNSVVQKYLAKARLQAEPAHTFARWVPTEVEIRTGKKKRKATVWDLKDDAVDKKIFTTGSSGTFDVDYKDADV